MQRLATAAAIGRQRRGGVATGCGGGISSVVTGPRLVRPAATSSSARRAGSAANPSYYPGRAGSSATTGLNGTSASCIRFDLERQTFACGGGGGGPAGNGSRRALSTAALHPKPAPEGHESQSTQQHHDDAPGGLAGDGGELEQGGDGAGGGAAAAEVASSESSSEASATTHARAGGAQYHEPPTAGNARPRRPQPPPPEQPRTTVKTPDDRPKPRRPQPVKSTFHRNRPRHNQRRQQQRQNQRQRPNRRQHNKHEPKPRPIPTSPWVCITNIPPLSTLDDILDELGKVLDSELRRGIVDLDEAERMLAATVAEERERRKMESTVRVDISPEDNAAAWEAEDWVGVDVTAEVQESTAAGDDGKNALQEEEKKKVEENEEEQPEAPSLPLWNPASAEESGRNLILEARLLLSILGRPLGWYVRLPNRSCVHALLTHAEEAGRAAVGAAASASSKVDSYQRAILTCGTKILDVGEFAPPPSPSSAAAGMPAGPAAPACSRDRGRNRRGEGGKILSGHFGAEQRSAIESSFRRAVDLRLDDSVVRVENCPVKSDADDIRYLFRRYDLVDERTLQPPPSRPPSRREGEGWGDRDRSGSRPTLAAVELLIRGNVRLNDHLRSGRGGGDYDWEQGSHGGTSVEGKGWKDSSRGGDGEGSKGQGEEQGTLVMTNTFLVRFDSPADARAVIRDMQMVEFMDRRLRLAQYPRQLLSSEENR